MKMCLGLLEKDHLKQSLALREGHKLKGQFCQEQQLFLPKNVKGNAKRMRTVKPGLSSETGAPVYCFPTTSSPRQVIRRLLLVQDSALMVQLIWMLTKIIQDLVKEGKKYGKNPSQQHCLWKMDLLDGWIIGDNKFRFP